MRMFLLVACLVAPRAWADLTIFDVRKNLPMSNTETVFRDFYINGGSESGVTVGMVITVQRRLPLYDSYSNRSAGDLQLKVARIKIIHVQKGLSVARMHSELARENAPLLEDNFIMIGDQLDLTTATSDKKAGNDDGPSPVASARALPQILVNSIAVAEPLPARSVAKAQMAPEKAPEPAPDVDVPERQ